MTQIPARRARPLSPHLSVWRPTITYVMSIVHRITGAALYFGTLLVAWWLIAAAVSERQFDIANAVMGSWFGIIVLIGFTWALMHHMLGGIRHFVWDAGALTDKDSSTVLAWASLAGSILLTVLIWVAFYVTRI
jgi:succinate dehydrogenase / fumarate reductase, cytochrome b subunit